MSRTARWYFDFVSPYSYLQCRLLDRLPRELVLEPKPILFAALLDHHGNLGPAEIPGKRLHTYRLCRWLATAHGLPFTMPPAHPFNPLRALRLAAALGATPAVVRGIFDCIWAEGRDVNDDGAFGELGRRFGIEDPLERVARPEAKAAVKANTDAAIADGVFGVPSVVIDGEVFWGVDAAGMLLDYLADPRLFADPEMARYPTLPVGADRKR